MEKYLIYCKTQKLKPLWLDELAKAASLFCDYVREFESTQEEKLVADAWDQHCSNTTFSSLSPPGGKPIGRQMRSATLWPKE